MEAVRVTHEGRQVIQSYGGGGFLISGTRHTGSVLVLPERTLPWPVTSAAGLVGDVLDPVLAPDAAIDLVLVGLGGTGGAIDKDLRDRLKQVRIAVETMSTAAACRTYNILLGEQRRVVAALIAVD
jgi:uncharacterized protein